MCNAFYDGTVRPGCFVYAWNLNFSSMGNTKYIKVGFGLVRNAKEKSWARSDIVKESLLVKTFAFIRKA